MIKRFFVIGLINLFFVFGIVQIGAYKNNQRSMTVQEIPTLTPTATVTMPVTPTPIIRIIKRIVKVTVTPGAETGNQSAQSPTTTNNQNNNQPAATSQPTQTPAAPTQNPSANRCIITIDGSQYDVTDFRNIHSGGNVFNCGSDMSAIFHNRHPNSFLSAMAQYKI